MTEPSYESFRVEILDRVAHVTLSRPEKRNSMPPIFWRELPELVRSLDDGARARVMVISADGPHFTSGLDLAMFAGMGATNDSRDARLQRPVQFMQQLQKLQDAFTTLEQSRLPILAAVQGGCIGGGVDMVTACDIRYATKDAYFTIQETNIGMTADVGTFPRLLKLIPEGMVRELAYTGRKMFGDEAKAVGLVNETFETQETMIDRVLAIAREIASKAPLAIYGCKKVITHARDHSTADGLEFIKVWNASMLHTEEIMEAISANAEGRAGDFAELPKDDTPIDG